MHRSTLTATTTALALSLALLPSPVAANLQVVGHEFRPTLAEHDKDDGCTGADGVTASLRFVCDKNHSNGACVEGDPPAGKLLAEWRSADGTLVAGPYVVSDHHARGKYTCGPDGAMALVVNAATLVLDRNGPRGQALPFCDPEYCSVRDAAVTTTPDGFFVVLAYSSELYGRFLATDGTARSTDFLFATGDVNSVDAVATGNDHVLVVWRGNGWPSSDLVVSAREVINASALNDVVVLNEFLHGESHGSVRVIAEPGGTFVASWTNLVTQGGWVARRISIGDVTPTSTTTTTTTTLDESIPAFLPARQLATTSSDVYGAWEFTPDLASDGAGRWMSIWEDEFLVTRGDNQRQDLGSMLSISTDDARRWSSPEPVAPDYHSSARDTRLATDDAGVSVLAWPSSGDRSVEFRRSADGGRTWSSRSVLYAPQLPAGLENPEYGMRGFRLAAGSGGHWVAAWSEWIGDYHYDSESGDGKFVNVLCAIRYSLSTDSGLTWRSARTIAEDDACGYIHDIAVESDRNGNWLIAWGQDGIRGSRSANNGSTWSVPRKLIAGDGHGGGSLVLAATRAGQWLLAFTGWLDTSDYFDTARIFVSRAAGAGGPWSPPEGLAPWHEDDGGRDTSPSIAAGDAGQFGIAWESHSGIGGIGLDRDIVVSFTNDAGTSWSTPKAVDPSAFGDTRTDTAPQLVHAGPTWGVLWRTEEEPAEHSGEWTSTVRFARTPGGCGDALPGVGEECDDGNAIEGDGCDTTCLLTRCGSEVTTAGEECDDGNDDDTDECLSDCRLAVCGDGATQSLVEACDDGNGMDSDACTNDCRAAVCGDGLVWDGVEGCDEGSDLDNNDECLTNCSVARCGDGYLHVGEENCDDGNTINDDGCSRKCKLDGVCADAPRLSTASDALRVLRKAVGLPARCSMRRCDTDDNGRITAIDALTTLRAAVGLSVSGSCSRPTSILVRLTSGGTLGALQFRLNYLDSAGDIPGSGARPACTVLPASVLSAMNIVPELGQLTVGLISFQGFDGPADLVRCDYNPVGGPSANDFKVLIQDATSTDGNAITPAPTLQVVAQ